MSHPTWVRGLKQEYYLYMSPTYMSHPTWVRGLKHVMAHNMVMVISRTLRGCVD